MKRLYLKLGIIVCTIPHLSQAMSRKVVPNVIKVTPPVDIAGRYVLNTKFWSGPQVRSHDLLSVDVQAYSLLGLALDTHYHWRDIYNARYLKQYQISLDYKDTADYPRYKKMWNELWKAYNLVRQRNYEKILGVSRDASLDEIEQAYQNYRARRKGLPDAVEQRGDLRDSYAKEDEAYEHLAYITNVRAERDQDKMKEQARLFDIVNPD